MARKRKQVDSDQEMEDQEHLNSGNSEDDEMQDDEPVNSNAAKDLGISSWLLNPIEIPSAITLDHSLKEYQLISPQIQSQIVHSHWFPVQKTIIPIIMSTDKDVLCSASTGSGKTLCYVLPILDKLYNRIVPRIRALIILPTKELSKQVYSEFMRYKTPLKIGLLGSKGITHEKEMLDRIDILVATPGRLVDHMQNRNFLKYLEILVLDEADRLLNQSFSDWLEKINSIKSNSELSIDENGIPVISPKSGKRIQKLLFSATLTRNPQKIASLKLYNPIYCAVKENRYNVPDTLKEHLIQVKETSDKLPALVSLLNKSTLVFVNTTKQCDRLAKFLELAGIPCATLSSVAPTKQSIRQFQNGKINTLVVTDLSCRGLDLCPEQVINYDPPLATKTYVHRIGRTARGGQSGSAFTILTYSQQKYFKENVLTRKISRKSDIIKKKSKVQWTDKLEAAVKELEKIYRKTAQEEHESSSDSSTTDQDSSSETSDSESSQEEDVDVMQVDVPMVTKKQFASINSPEWTIA